ncbi:hypothetical protein PG614_06035 [Riemerella anatipestifer]|nr:hypothetical protein [Riemerella anatipestifer]
MVNDMSHASIWGEKMGSGYTGGLNPYSRSWWSTQAAQTNVWYSMPVGINPSNRDFLVFTINLNSTNEVYRINVVSNALIPTSSSIPEVPAKITFFIEKLQ